VANDEWRVKCPTRHSPLVTSLFPHLFYCLALLITLLVRYTMRYLIALVFICLNFQNVEAQKPVQVRGSYSMVLERNRTIEETEKLCTEQARLTALAAAFGTSVTETTVSKTADVNGTADNAFHVLTRTNVGGEWIADDASPIITWKCYNEELQLNVDVIGTARAFPKKGKTDLVFFTCTSTDPNREETNFKERESLNAVFQSAQDGFISVYYIDRQSQMASRLLPTAGGKNINALEVHADDRYVLFNRATAHSYGWGAMSTELELSLPAGKTSVMDEVVVVFAPESFAKPMHTGSKEGLSELPLAEFENWLATLKVRQPLAQEKRKEITIQR
jgi:hypothetical protein